MLIWYTKSVAATSVVHQSSVVASGNDAKELETVISLNLSRTKFNGEPTKMGCSNTYGHWYSLFLKKRKKTLSVCSFDIKTLDYFLLRFRQCR